MRDEDLEERDEPEDAYDEAADKIGSYDPESENLAIDFSATEDGEDFLKELARKVIDNFDRAYDSTEEYRKHAADDWRIFSGDLPPKEPPFQDCANPHVPIMLENITRLYFRARGELFNDWSNVFGVLPVGPDDEDVAEILTLHGNWQIRNQITDFKRQMYRGLLAYFGIGDITGHSYYDSAKHRNCHEVLTPDDFVIPFVHVSVEPDYSDVPFKVKILRRYKHEIQRMRGKWNGVDKILKRKPPSVDDDPEPVGRMIVADVQGEDVPEDLKNQPYKILWYEGYFELPGDDYDTYCKVLVDYTTRTVAHLSVHEEDDWQDRLRYEKQAAELDAYRQASALYQQTVPHMQMEQDALMMHMDAPGVDPAEREHLMGAMQEQPLPPPPPAPEWLEGLDPDDPMTAPEPVRKVPIQMFTHGICVEPLYGSLGIGYGRFEADCNRAANTALAQFTDSATLANIPSLITTDIEFEPAFKIAPGHINKAIGVSAEQLQKCIYQLNFPPANAQLTQIVQFMTEYGQSAAQSPEVLSGEPGKSGETYRGIATRIEQATKQLSEATRGFADGFLVQVLKNNAKLNAIYLPDEEIVQINDHKIGHLPQEITIGKALYNRDYRVEIRADLRFTSDAQRIAEADEVLQLRQAAPPLQGNIAYYYMAVKRCLEARGQWALVQQLGPPPPPPETPLGIPPPPPPGMPIMPGPPGPPGGPPPGPTNGKGAPLPSAGTAEPHMDMGNPSGAGGPVAPSAPSPPRAPAMS